MKSIKFFTVVLALAGLSACGGGDGGSAAPAAGSGGGVAPASMGVLTDDPVGGVSCSSPSFPNQVTGGDGSFQFRAGEMITFNFAGVAIQVPASDRITPAVLAENLFPNDPTSRANATTNLSILLQTIDADGEPDNRSITVRSGAMIEGIDDVMADLSQSPETFSTTLMIENQGNATIRNDGADPVPPNPDDALARFYRNELAGTWVVARFEPTSGPVETAESLDEFAYVLNFDSGCVTNCTGGGRTLINRFVSGDYDSEDTSHARIGRVVYARNDSTEPNETRQGEFIIRNLNPVRSIRTGGSGGSTDPMEDIYEKQILLDSNELIVRFDDGDLVFTRFVNQKGSLIGTWVEDLSGENSMATGAPRSTGRLNFDPGVRTIVYNFLSSTRAMIIVTDLDPLGNNDGEQNGVAYLDYAFQDGTFTVSNILSDTTAATAGGGIVAQGDELELSVSDLNDTKRTFDAGGTEPIDIYRLLSITESLNESSAGFKQPTADSVQSTSVN